MGVLTWANARWFVIVLVVSCGRVGFDDYELGNPSYDVSEPRPDVCGDATGLDVTAPWPQANACPTNARRSKATGPTTGATKLPPSGADNGAAVGAAVGPGASVFVQYFNGGLALYDGTTGAQRWLAPAGSSFSLFPILTATGFVITVSSFGKAFAWDATTGANIWDVQQGGSFSPATMGPAGTIYFGANTPYGFYAMDARTGSLTWNVPHGADLCCSGPTANGPALAGGRVFYGDINNNLHALDAATGAEAWVTSIASGIRGSPVITIDTVAVATNVGIETFDAATGTPGWTFAAGKPTSQPALLANGNLVTATSDGVTGVVLDRKTGEQLFTFDCGGTLRAPPVVDANDDIYVGTNQSTRSFSGQSGAQRWESPLVGRPLLGDGVLYVLTNNNGTAFAVIGP